MGLALPSGPARREVVRGEGGGEEEEGEEKEEEEEAGANEAAVLVALASLILLLLAPCIWQSLVLFGSSLSSTFLLLGSTVDTCS